MLFIDVSLARRLERNEAQFAVEYAEAVARLHPEIEAAAQPLGRDDADGRAVYGGPNAPVNRAIGMGLDGPLDDAQLDLVEAFYRTRALPSRIDLCPLADPSLAELLGRRAYRIGSFINVYARALTAEDALAPPSDGVDITVVGETEAELFARTVIRGFMGCEDVPQSAVDVGLPTVSIRIVRCYLARVDGVTVGGGTLSVWEGLAGLAGTSTIVPFRGRGVQTALLRARLAAAVVAGCDLATIRTLPGTVSERNVRRAGFQLAYTKLVMFRDWS